MIQGFESETRDLTTYEMEVVLPKIVNGLSKKIGKQHSVTNKDIVRGLQVNCNITITEPRVRKIINYIRNRGIVRCLIATSTGYYIASHQSELVEYIDSLIGREEAIASVRKSMQEQLRHFG